MATDAHDDVELTARCLCRANVFRAAVGRASLPLPLDCCHCRSCRHMSGSLYTAVVPWPGPAEAVVRLAEASPAPLVRYAFGPTSDVFFCATCSSPMFFRRHRRPEQAADDDHGAAAAGDSLSVYSGVLANSAEPDLIRLNEHIFVGDTVDGGASVWLRHANVAGAPAPAVWLGDEGTSDRVAEGEFWPSLPDQVALVARAEARERVEIPVRCHCGGVNLVLRRGHEDFARMRQPGGGAPQWDEREGDEAKAREELPWFVEPSTYRLLASFDACDSCRTVFGVADTVNWTFTRLRDLDFAEPAASPGSSASSSFPRTTHELAAAVDAARSSPGGGRGDPRLASLLYYRSSEDVQRYACRRCSASVFYAVDCRPDIVDLAIGLLDAPEGARAESWLAWDLDAGGKADHREDAGGVGWRAALVEVVERDAEDWRKQRGWEKTWLRAASEKEEAEAAAKAG